MVYEERLFQAHNRGWQRISRYEGQGIRWEQSSSHLIIGVIRQVVWESGLSGDPGTQSSGLLKRCRVQAQHRFANNPIRVHRSSVIPITECRKPIDKRHHKEKAEGQWHDAGVERSVRGRSIYVASERYFEANSS